ncbi:type 1 fimbrial protein [Enterobacteriaceae bacterium H20N1]|uniref:Type 1 fimbrial protein n=1 Tax=Dryocola boscaweniae TaxID=2925397 RepID=A0A9X2W915_9ENTR|nr:fimbrial protein [Dryocola boscaweniae]MCT4703373.1 type 1 fimbrial protein [Dryocola boscaweniae]MCT4720541.1 type 1 fimbrial protein [Dryocola boscaweniae]
MHKFKLTLCALLLTTASASALAADETQGTVTFNGELYAETCSIASDSVDVQVTLPKVSIQTLKASADAAGSKGFDLNVENCPVGITQVAAHFEAISSSGVNSATGNLTNQYQGASAKASNVEVRLYNSDEKQLKLGETGAPAQVSNGKATMRYYGGYYATAATTAGLVYAQARYTLAYP